jgi:hypothetical protein
LKHRAEIFKRFIGYIRDDMVQILTTYNKIIWQVPVELKINYKISCIANIKSASPLTGYLFTAMTMSNNSTEN